jgi:thymidylate kinase
VTNLNRRGIPSIYVSFPGREQGGLGKLVYELQHDPESACGLGAIHPVSNQLLHVAAHIQQISKVIRPALADDYWVILDRYWWSTWVYGRVNDAPESALDLMVRIELEQWNPITPEIVFLVTRTCQASEPSLPFTNDLTDRYEDLASQGIHQSKVVRIDTANRPRLESLRDVLKFIPEIDQSESYRFSDSTRRQNAPNTISHSFAKRIEPHFSPVMDTYWRFAAQRQKIFFARLRGERPPWTDDPILQKHKFTNAYRASDRVSQYLIRRVIYGGPQNVEDVVFRTLLFKLFNKIETWELLSRHCGEIRANDFSAERYAAVLSAAQERHDKIYSAAYIMPSGQLEQRKHIFHLGLLQRMLSDHLPAKIASCGGLESVFEILRSYPSLGPFLAFQFTIDLNYGPIVNFDEMEFVVPGPGARDGIRKCFQSFGEYSEADLIRFVANQQHHSFERLGIEFQNLWGRMLHLVDCQNLFCEVDKYARVAHPEYSGVTGRTRIKQIFRANMDSIPYWYPPKWGLNERVQCEVSRYASV